MALSQWRPQYALHHGGQGMQGTSIVCGNRRRSPGVWPTMGSGGDFYEYAMGDSFLAPLECGLLTCVRFQMHACEPQPNTFTACRQTSVKPRLG